MTSRTPTEGASLTRFATRGPNRLSYETFGEAVGTPVLGLHDLLADRGQLRALAGALREAGFPVILPDARGHGAAAMVSGIAYPSSELAADAQAVLDAERVEAGHVVAVGWGASAALTLATIAPARVASLVLIEPYLPAVLLGHPDASAREYAEAHLKVHQEAILAASRGQTDRVLELYPGVRWGAGWRELASKPRQGAIRRASANLAPHLAALAPDMQDVALLEKVTTPTTVLVRQDAPLVERWTAEAISLQLPGAGVQSVFIPAVESDPVVVSPAWTPAVLGALQASRH